jgi:hypothetical protein
VLQCDYLVEPATLLDDLLEDSGRVYHRHCAIIQRIFHEQWLETLDDEVGKEQLESPDAAPALVESRARQRLEEYRLALREKAVEMIREQQDQRAERDRAICAYVASLPAASTNRAA